MTTVIRKPYIAAADIVSQLLKKLNEGAVPDYITLGGSGEPTLNSDIGKIIDDIKAATDIPVAVLTNGSLLSDHDVRDALSRADVVLPSFDAYDATMFSVINRPHTDISFDRMARGLIDFRKEYAGRIWLEIFLVEGLNDTPEHMEEFSKWIEKMNPDKVHINTAVRPAAEKFVTPVSYERLKSLCRILGSKAEIITPFEHDRQHHRKQNIDEEILSLLSRRPCTLTDMAAGLGVSADDVMKHLGRLMKENVIESVQKGSEVYYQHKMTA